MRSSLSRIFWVDPPPEERQDPEGLCASFFHCLCGGGGATNRIVPSRLIGPIVHVLSFLPFSEMFRLSSVCRAFHSGRRFSLQRTFSPDELFILNRLFRLRRLPHSSVKLIEDYAVRIRIVRVKYRKKRAGSAARDWKSTFLYVNKVCSVGELKVLAGFVVDRTPCTGQLCALYYDRRKLRDSEMLSGLVPLQVEKAEAILLTAKHMRAHPIVPPITLRGLLSQGYLFKSLLIHFIASGMPIDTNKVMQIVGSYGIAHLVLYGKSLLEYAWEFENLPVVRFLWLLGNRLIDNVDRRIGARLKTHLHVCVEQRNVELTQAILEEYGASQIDVDCRDREGETPLHYACGPARPRIVRQFSSSASFSSAIELEAPEDECAEEFPVSISEIPESERVALRVSLIRLLVAHSARVNVACYRRRDSPLHVACSAPEDVPDVVLALIENGADVEAINGVLQRPIHLAAVADSMSKVRALVDSGVDLVVRDDLGANPLHLSVENGNFKMSSFLLSANKVPRAKLVKISRPSSFMRAPTRAYPGFGGFHSPNLLKKTPLHFAVAAGNVDILKMLLDDGADFDPSEFGDPPPASADLTPPQQCLRLLYTYQRGDPPRAEGSRRQAQQPLPQVQVPPRGQRSGSGETLCEVFVVPEKLDAGNSGDDAQSFPILPRVNADRDPKAFRSASSPPAPLSSSPSWDSLDDAKDARSHTAKGRGSSNPKGSRSE